MSRDRLYVRRSTVDFRRKPVPWCATHGIRLHGRAGHQTFVYLNGPGTERESVTCNFPIERPFADRAKTILKAEKDRLGYENSEDAVTWNVFAGLLSAGLLSRAAEELTGRMEGTPELWLWGHRIDLQSGFGPRFAPLVQLRERLEPDVHTFVTEPDIMLVFPQEFIVLIEAKFTSGIVRRR